MVTKANYLFDSIDTQTKSEIQRIFHAQREQRSQLKASTADERKQRLERLRNVLTDHAHDIDQALFDDLRKPRMGDQHFELISVLEEIDLAIAELAIWMAPERVAVSDRNAGGKAEIRHEPKGVCLLFGAWNFPFALTLAPLVPMIAAGNAVIIKPNELQPATSRLIARLLSQVFDENEVVVFEGGVPLAELLLTLPFDHVFFTGSPTVGKRVMQAAAQNLSSVTLELGGKCPVIADDSTDLKVLASKIVGARFFNAGQLCLACDHVWLPVERRDEFVGILRSIIGQAFYPTGKLDKSGLARIVDSRNMARLESTLANAMELGATVVIGGQVEPEDLTFHPTVLVDVPLHAKLMQEEIFGPILPVMTYTNVQDVFEHIDATGKPLAVYVFSQRPEFVEQVLLNTSSGGVTVNDVLRHYQEIRLPFGGVNQSGMGRYKGQYGFRELSNARSVFIQP
ncbi:aldehyde dehydrogenase family protein [Pseudomonas sp. NFX15]|uniref:aldehyde dehydrogenase family protein n=1 Tax=Pseudomonas sp. NFX15 TaxID=2816958 RepID=UPI003B8D1097